jgi:sulfur carrier protein ThiS adenylyltransferase
LENSGLELPVRVVWVQMCAIALARCGVGTIVLADFDSVELSNLSRQYYFSDQVGLPKTAALRETILKIRPETTVIAIQEKLDQSNIPEVFSGCAVIIEAFDSPEMKQMLIETVQNSMRNTSDLSALDCRLK